MEAATRIICGDAAEVLRTLCSDRAALTITSQDDGGARVTVDDKDGVTFCGHFNGSATFDAADQRFKITSRGNQSMFLCRLTDRTGSRQ